MQTLDSNQKKSIVNRNEDAQGALFGGNMSQSDLDWLQSLKEFGKDLQLIGA